MTFKKKSKDLNKREIQRQKDAVESYARQHNGNGPVTRRDFLAAGAIPFVGRVTAPTVFSLVSQWARAQESQCPNAATSGADRLAAFVTLNLTGGAMLAGNYVPMDAGGQTLPSYNKLGLGNSSLPITREFNNAPFAGDGISQLIEGLRESCSSEARTNTAFIAIPCRGQDDSGDNKYDASGMVAKAGLIGDDLPNLGRNDTSTGVRQDYAQVKPPNPLRVRSYNDLAGAVGGSGSGALASLSTDQNVSLFRLIQNLNTRQSQRVLASSGGNILSQLVQCASGKNTELAGKAVPPIDVRQNAQLAEVWGVNANTGAGNENVVFGSMVTAGLTGAAGTVGLERGGYDYHNNTRTTGDERDRIAGSIIGRVLQSAHVLSRPVYLYVTTDGACSAPVSESRSAPWRSDRGSAGMAFVFAYHPNGRPATNGFQIGQFNSAQAADDDFITGGSPALTSAAVFANYLKFNNRMDLLESIIPGTFNIQQLNSIIKFG